MSRFVLFIFLLASLTGYSTSVNKFQFNKNCAEAYRKYISFRFEEGERILNVEKKNNPHNALPYYIENIEDAISIFVSEEKHLFDKLKGNKEVRMKILEKADKASPYYNLCLAEMHLQWAIARIKFDEYTTAALELNKAYRLLKDNKEKFPAFHLTDKSLGLLHVLIGTIPDSYKWVANILGIKGTINQGLMELRSFYNLTFSDSSYAIFQTEASVYLGMVLINYTPKEEEALRIFERIKKMNYSNPMLTYIYGSIGLKTGRSKEVDEYFTKHKFGKGYFPFHYLELQHGQAKINNLDNDAIRHFENYIHNFKGINYIKSCHQYMAWHYLIHQDEIKFQKYFKLIDGPGAILVDEDKQALKNYRNNDVPDVNLLKARLLFDGGNYRKSFAILASAESKELHKTQHKLEYIYRLARNYQKMDNLESAINNYEKTYNIGSKLPFYFAEAAAVQLGMHYELAGNKIKAAEWYEKALEVSKHEFKNSLDQKAKAGLNRMQKN